MEYKSRSVVIIGILAIVLLAGPVFSQTEWKTYHFDGDRRGVNDAVTTLSGPTMQIVWTFPRHDVMGESQGYIVDIPDTSGWELEPSAGIWQSSGDLPGNFYDDDNDYSLNDPGFYYTRAVTQSQITTTARWYFPSTGTNAGSYVINVWFPSGTNHTSAAKYTVVCKGGTKKTFTIDQKVGGQWVQLGSEPLPLDDDSYVELSNITDDADRGEFIVCADAVQFVPPTGIEMYSSPAASRAAVGYNNTDIPAVWIGTIESPIASRAPGVIDFGAIYCVRSYQGIGLPVDQLLDSNSTIWDTEELRGVGTAAWRYPRAGSFDTNDDGTLKSPNDRLPIEGPIGGLNGPGGVYSSPTLVTYDTELLAIVGGMDGQVYCLNATTGELKWKGPGVTIPEELSSIPPSWTVVEGRCDAFGGRFAYGPCVKDSTEERKITWNINGTNSDPGLDAAKTNTGHMYAIYAWIPGRDLSTEASYRSRDAAYSITYHYVKSDGSIDTRTDVVRIDQRDPSDEGTNCGRWVRIGGDYWNPTKVELSNMSQAGDTDRVVVADAIMVVPAEIGPFSYSTAVSDGTNVYIGNTNGRVYAFKLNPGRGDYNSELVWTFPKVQTRNPVSSSELEYGLASPFGSIVSSPAITGGLLIVSSMDGKVYAITNLYGGESGVRLEWTFDTSTLSSFGAEPFSSSPVINGSKVYVASTGGRLFAINTTSGEYVWSYPDITNNLVPLAAFRFSTPAVYDNRIFCGSTGGQVHGFIDNGTSCEILPGFTVPNLYAPIQGAVAIDGRNIYMGTIGVGDGDDGGIWWVNRDTGLPADGTIVWEYSGYTGLGMVFSSPAVANDYMYVGTGKGRLCAFSSIAFGGAWVGGGREQAGQSPYESNRTAAPDPSVTSQVDVFSYQVYSETLKAFEEIVKSGTNTNSQVIGTLINSVSGINSTNLFVESSFDGNQSNILEGHKRAFPYGTIITTSAIREIYLEWGEDLYLIAWNLPRLIDIQGSGSTTSGVGSSSKKNSVRFRLNNSGPGASSGATINPKNADYLFEYKTDETDDEGNPVYKSIAFAKISLAGSGRNQPSPGTGWNVTVTVSRTGNAPPAGVVPLLTGSPGSFNVIDPSAWTPQDIGVNNPIAIRDDGLRPIKNGEAEMGPKVGLGWPSNENDSDRLPDGTYRPNRFDPTAHFNGNTMNIGGQWQRIYPHIYLDRAPHGANSRVARLEVMDRSAMGLKPNIATDADGNQVVNWTGIIDRFRLQTSDLRWHGGNNAVINPLPWDYPPYSGSFGYESRVQRDYPDIPRYTERFQKDTGDPSIDNNTLLPALPKNIDDPNSTNYDEARLQGETIETWVEVPKYQPANLNGPGYIAEVTAYIDSNNDGTFNHGDHVSGRPTSYVEAHRHFTLSMDVMPDYSMVIDRPLTIDIVGADGSVAPHGLGLYLGSLELTDWWKEFTVRNTGNVNLSNIKVAKTLSYGGNTWNVELYSDTVSSFMPLSGTNIISTLDGWDPELGPLNDDLFMTPGHGFTLSKSRVGEVTPMELTIPDKRKIEELPDVKATLFARTGKSTGILPKISATVPLTQPTGTYSQLIPVYADMGNVANIAYGGTSAGINNNILDLGIEPFTEPTFRINVPVAENRLTGGATPGSLTQIDPPQPIPSEPVNERFVSGDTQPAAWRDPYSGNTYLFWSTNRFGGATISPNSPWYIGYARLKYGPMNRRGLDKYSWEAYLDGSTPQWWETASDRLPGFEWPTNPNGLMRDTIKYSSPFAAMNFDTISDNNPMRVWLFMKGQADVENNTTKKIDREHRILYTQVSDDNSGSSNTVYTFTHNLSLAKQNPKAIVYNSGSEEHMWLMWHGGDSGRWSIFGNLNVSPAERHEQNAWCGDVRFTTPTCLVSVSDPSPVHRRIGAASDSDRYIDVAYTGASKYDQSSDIFLTRYKWSGSYSAPKVDVVRMPRIYNEELRRDTKRNVYTSEHLAWVRPPNSGSIDQITGSSTSPVVRVMLVEDYTLKNGTTLPAGTILSATDSSVSRLNPDGRTFTLITEGAALAPSIDQATGVYTYTPKGDAGEVIGQMLADFSAGIVRFTNPLPPKTKVYAYYTPQARRLTRGEEQDTTPFMFMEKTPMDSVFNPGFDAPDNYNGPTPVDRLWLFWRKPNTSGVQASTIYYKTYRITATLAQPIDMNTNGRPSRDVTISGVLGPCEISWDGRKVYFTGVDERYPDLGVQSPVTITYTPRGATNNETVTETFETLTWVEELPETALPTRLMVNEGPVCAFADPCVRPSRIWVFWSSTRAGKSDLYYQTISPNFRAASNY